MSLKIEGKVSQLIINPVKKEIIFSIKALKDYYVKQGDSYYNLFITSTSDENPKSINALLCKENKEFEIDAQYGALLNSMRDNAITFVFNEDDKGVPKELESLTVKY